MSKLYEARRSNLSNPLTKDEVGYTFNCENINYIINNIDEEKYGSYLIGGIVGTGKSSLVDIAAAYSKKKTLTIHVNFYNEKEIIEKFSKIVLECLIDKIENESGILDDKLSKLVRKCKLELYYSIDEQLDKKETTNSGIKQMQKEHVSLFSKMRLAIKGIFSSEANIEGEEILENENYSDENREIKKSISLTKIEHDRIKDILNIIRQLDNLNTIFIFDELDKMNIDVLESLFEKYKCLFVENNIFNFFLVDDEMYLKYSDNNICKNKLYTYFSGKYYLPLLSFEETVRYCVMMFGESDYLTCLFQYYNTLGNYRLLNISYNEDKYLKKMTVIKAYIFIRVIDKIDVPYLEACYLDSIIKKIKIVIEESIKLRNFTIKDFECHLEKSNAIDNVWPGNQELINWVIEVIKDIFPQAIEIEDNRVSINATTLYNQYELFEKAALSYRKENLKEEARNIQLSDMYHYLKNGDKVYKQIAFLSENIIPLEVAKNNPKTYEEALINLVKANLYQKKMQVIILQRERGEESYYKNDHEYTGIIVVDKGAIQVAYYVDRGSYDSDSFDAMEKLVNVSNQYGVDVKKMKIENYIDLNKDIRHIVKKYNAV